MPPRHRLRLTAPATRFVDGFPLGNGWLGAVLRGSPGEEHLDLNADTLWSGGPLEPETGPAPSRLLPELRAAIAAGEHVRADELARQVQGPGYTQSYQPVGGLVWEYSSPAGLAGYHRELDLAAAVATTGYTTTAGAVRLDTFVSGPDGVVVAAAGGDGLGELRSPRWSGPHPGVRVVEHVEDGVRWTTVTGRAPRHVVPNYVEVEDPVHYAVDVPAPDGTVPAGTGFAVVVAVQAHGGTHRLLASVATGFRGHDQRPSADLEAIAGEARARVAAAAGVPTEELRRRHEEEHRGYFDRVDLDLTGSPPAGGADPAREELFFHYGRYLLIGCSRPGTQAATLQGIWNADVRPAWSSNYTTNINLTMNYWPAEVLGLGDVHAPLFDLAADLAVAGRSTAARYYAAGGAAVHHNTDVWRFTTPVVGDPAYANWPSALPWIAAHLAGHREFSPGEETGRTRDVLRAAAAFVLDLLVPGPDGTLLVSPSTSPEHAFLVDGTRAVLSAGCAMDQELAHEVLTSFADLVDATGGWDDGDDGDLARRARTALAALAPVTFGADGRLLEWAHEHPPVEPGHRHLSHLYGLYPGTRITAAGTPRDFEGARRALAARVQGGSGYTGWSQAWILCLAARLRDRDLAERSLAILLDDLTSDSLLDLHPHDDWPGGSVFQIDGNFGAVAGMVELLVQSHEGAITLLPATPRGWSEGRVAGIRCRGGVRVDVTWSAGRLTSAVVVNGAGTSLTLDVPDDGSEVGVLDASTGREVPRWPDPPAPDGRRRLTWSAAPGAAYRVSPA